MRIALVIAVTLFAHTVAADPYRNPYSGIGWNSPMVNLTDTWLRNASQSTALRHSIERQNGTRLTEHQQFSMTDFTPAGQRLAVDGVIAWVAQTPQQRQIVGNAVTTIFARYERTHRPNNVAYAVAFLIGNSLAVQTGRPLDVAQGDELAHKINDMFAGNPQFMAMKATDRQMLYEICVTLGGLVAYFDELGRQDPAWSNAAKLLAKQSLASFGMQ
jgi:hypothetical protein